ncbi:MAG: hypothetical protein WBN75_06465 [Verrucomicrobiia bacterium]
MNAPQKQNAKAYKVSFIINTTVGFLLLLGFILEGFFPALQGGRVAWILLPVGLLLSTIGLQHRRKYLSLSR